VLLVAQSARYSRTQRALLRALTVAASGAEAVGGCASHPLALYRQTPERTYWTERTADPPSDCARQRCASQTGTENVLLKVLGMVTSGVPVADFDPHGDEVEGLLVDRKDVLTLELEVQYQDSEFPGGIRGAHKR